jgi:hypothetical protein
MVQETSIPVADGSSGSQYVSSGLRLDDQRSLIAGLGLLTLTLSVFLPSRRFLPYVQHFVRCGGGGGGGAAAAATAAAAAAARALVVVCLQ